MALRVAAITTSSSIRQLEYDTDTETLTITFASNGRYAFLEVPEARFAEMLGAESRGRYFQARIRGRYVSVKQAPTAHERRVAAGRLVSTPNIGPDQGLRTKRGQVRTKFWDQKEPSAVPARRSVDEIAALFDAA